MWERPEARVALLELHARGRLPRRSLQREAWTWLSELEWTRTSTRQDELLLDPRQAVRVVELLERVWPAWAEILAALEEGGHPPTPKGLIALADAQRAARDDSALPARLNRRTAAAIVAPHSKATLTPARTAALGTVEITHDGSVRMRPPPGVTLAKAGATLDAAHVAAGLGEIAVSERALADGLRIAGPIAGLLSVENLGPFQDLLPPEGWLVLHVAGWNTATTRRVLAQLAQVPLVHFGDLDPNGARIARHIATLHPDVHWAAPSFWEEHVPDRALRASWPSSEELDLSTAHGRDVDLLRLHHRVEHSLRRGGVRVPDPLGERDRRDLPVEAPPVLAPAAARITGPTRLSGNVLA